MEVKLDKRYPVSASLEQAWSVLRDIRATAACMPGAQITEQIDDKHFKGTVKSKVGPATLLLAGDIELIGIEPQRRELHLRGKGADRAGSSASMDLTARLEPAETSDACTLVGQASVVVGGKLAQFGGRLLVPVSDAMLAQFAQNFVAAAQAVPRVEVSAMSARLAGSNMESTLTLMVQSGQAPGSVVPSPAGPPVKELNVLGLVWAAMKVWWKGLFGRGGRG